MSIDQNPDLYDLPYTDYLGGTNWRRKVVVSDIDLKLVIVGPGTKPGTVHVQTTNNEPELEQVDFPVKTLYDNYRLDIDQPIPRGVNPKTGFDRYWEAVTIKDQFPVRRVGTLGTMLFDGKRVAWTNYEGLDEEIIEALESVRFLTGDCFVDEHGFIVNEDDIIIRRVPWHERRLRKEK